MSEQVRVELCHESGCGLIVVDVNEKQYRVDLMPNEVLEARALLANNSQAFQEFVEDIDPKFNGAFAAIGVAPIAKRLSETKLPKILKEMEKS